MDQTVAISSPERLTRGAKSKDKRNIQSNPFISQVGEIEVVMNDEVAGSIPADGSSKAWKRSGRIEPEVGELE